MTLTLTEKDRSMLKGDFGPAARMALSIVVRMAGVVGADALLDITAAHIDSTVYIGAAGLEFAERLARLGAKVCVPTTLNVSGLDEFHWQEWAVPAEWARQAHRQMLAYQGMGTTPTWTCAPYQLELRPAFGQQIAWGESNAIAFANSVLGARTERYPDLFDICCAISGRAPATGLHLAENRGGQLLFRLSADVSEKLQYSDDFYTVLGNLVGKQTLDKIPVIDGLTGRPDEDQLKAFCAAAASSGGVALFHMVGITPEAPSLEHAFQGTPPVQAIEIGMQALRLSRQQLTHGLDDQLDLVVLGCPHFSLAEFKRLAPLLEGRHTHPGVKFLVTSSRFMTGLARQTGLLQALEAFGGQLTVDTCTLASPMLPAEIKCLMTNSAKFAYYAPGMLEKNITFGSLQDCVDSACAGRVIRDGSLWDE
ncbi:MAG: hypothetical protein A2X25_15240 [Chloroflexi bacterium GWB2_49_20]|nr:MAG: hypothetical protein A2X25_15240 [Chloroflexi bacterium GWB2_49_20]OGN80411.1 MAG: hypothetical protein A2X26_14005 [Chloroflexi bacterium GWC2_49_37]OGN84309.1 MAG: hypothetical protein A2X27_12785 [Chloroflexi bacterium GWD2_49_16]